MTTESNTPEQSGTAPASLTVNDAAERINSLFQADPDTDNRDDEETPEQELEAGADEGEQPEDEDAESTEQDEDKADDEDGEKPQDETRVKLKDGREVTLDELEKGYLRQSDYTRKAQEVAETRKQAEAAQTQIAQQTDALQQQLQLARAIAEAHLPPRPDPALLSLDPTGYYQQEKQWELAVGRVQQIAQAQNELSNRAKSEQDKVLSNYIAKEQEQLLQKLPDLKDETKRKAIYEDLVSGLAQHYGLSADEVSKVHNHQLVLMARDAIAYRKLQAERPRARAIAAQAPPVVRPTARAAHGSVKQERFNQGVKALQKTGRRDIAERLLADF